jgi:hypothetical protein
MSRDDIRRAVARAGLLARNGTLVLAVHAIDRQQTPTPPNVEIDLVDLYADTDAFARVQLRDPADWNSKVEPAIRNAARELEAYATRRVHVTGSMRLPLWFAVGRALPDVRGWILSLDQRTEEWSTDAAPEPVTARVLEQAHLGDGPELAIAISITHDIAEDVARHISQNRLSAGPARKQRGHLRRLGNCMDPLGPRASTPRRRQRRSDACPAIHGGTRRARPDARAPMEPDAAHDYLRALANRVRPDPHPPVKSRRHLAMPALSDGQARRGVDGPGQFHPSK